MGSRPARIHDGHRSAARHPRAVLDHDADVDVPSRRLDAPRRQHALPLDLRRQPGKGDGPPVSPLLFDLRRRGRRGAHPVQSELGGSDRGGVGRDQRRPRRLSRALPTQPRMLPRGGVAHVPAPRPRFLDSIQFINGVGSVVNTPETGGVAYLAHIGGFVAGLKLAAVRGRPAQARMHKRARLTLLRRRSPPRHRPYWRGLRRRPWNFARPANARGHQASGHGLPRIASISGPLGNLLTPAVGRGLRPCRLKGEPPMTRARSLKKIIRTRAARREPIRPPAATSLPRAEPVAAGHRRRRPRRRQRALSPTNESASTGHGLEHWFAYSMRSARRRRVTPRRRIICTRMAPGWHAQGVTVAS